MKKNIRIILGLGILVFVFVIGWVMPKIYEYNDNETSLWGLKFIPPCEPLGGNATCGVDLVFIVVLLVYVIFLIVFVKEGGKNGNKRCLHYDQKVKRYRKE